MAKVEKLNMNIQKLIDKAIKNAESTNNMDILAAVIIKQTKILQKIVDKQDEIIEAISIDKKYI